MPRTVGKRDTSLAVLSEENHRQSEQEKEQPPIRIENINDERRLGEAFTYEVFIGKKKPLRVMALMDTGATGLAYIDPDVARYLCKLNGVALTKLVRSIPLTGFSGVCGKPLTHALYLPMQVGSHYEGMATFYVTKIARYSVIIGRDWMKQHGVVLDTTNGSVLFKPRFCQHNSRGPKHLEILKPPIDAVGAALDGHVELPCPPPEAIMLPKVAVPIFDPEHTRNRKVMPAPVLPKKILVRPLKQMTKPIQESSKSTKYLGGPAPPDIAPGPESQSKTSTSTQQICLISGSAFSTAARQTGAEVFAISMQEILQQKEKEKNALTAAQDLRQLVPSEFHEFLDVFSAAKAKDLPPHREKWDHRIQLKDDAQLPRTEPLRRLSPDELTVLKEYLTENLNRAWITPSTAEYASPILFVKKPNGGIRFCVDYRGLNAVTKKNQYPLPLIDETIARVVKAKIYTKFDIIQAFHRIRMATEKDEELSTFTCRFGTYKYRVLPFGLSGGPSTYQQFMNDNFLDYESFVSCYIDDLIVFSDSIEEHKKHVRLVLSRLREMGIQADILKTEFFTTEVKYLGLIITPQGVKMDPSKVEIVKNWPKPKNGGDTRAIRRFIGFVNFYRRFIRKFSKLARPLNDLLKKDSLAVWDEACDRAFESIKAEISKEPTMAHFDPAKESFVECDSSDAATGGILSQLTGDVLQPVAFFSKSLGPAERNYAIYDKEMLAIIRCFEEWKPELISAAPDSPIQVLTDHKALEYFMSTKQLTRRQARWAEELSQYNFKITFRPGAKNAKADLLTRDIHNDEVSRAKQDPHLRQTLLKPEHLSPEVQEAYRVSAAKVSGRPETSESSITAKNEIAVLDSNEPQTLEDVVIKANSESEQFAEIRQELIQPSGIDKLHGYRLDECTTRNGLLYQQGKLIVPQSTVTKVISVVHSGKEVGHAGVAKTIKAIEATYTFAYMDRLVRQFCRNCYDCLRTKPVLKAPSGLLQPLPIPEKPWTDISVDFVVQLPKTKRGNNSLMVVVDRLSKERHYIPCSAGDEEEGLSAEATAWMFYTHIWRLHGLPMTVVSDRGSQFVNGLWEYLCRILGIKAKLSTAFHPQTDGQTEIANREMERYLRTFVSHYQDNWDELSPSAEFAINASESESTKLSPFMATRGCQPRMSFNAEQLAQTPKTARERLAFGKAKAITEPMKAIWDWTKAWMTASQEKQKHYADQTRREGISVKVGDLVWLNMKNIKTTRPSKKLDSKWEGPFRCLEKVGNVSYKLDLPSSMKIHPVFHQSLLSKHADDPLPGQEYPTPEPVTIDGQEEWEVEDILDVKKGPGRGDNIQIRVSWVGHPPDLTYYPSRNFENSVEYLVDYYDRHPGKPKPQWLLAKTSLLAKSRAIC